MYRHQWQYITPGDYGNRNSRILTCTALSDYCEMQLARNAVIIGAIKRLHAKRKFLCETRQEALITIPWQSHLVRNTRKNWSTESHNETLFNIMQPPIRMTSSSRVYSTAKTNIFFFTPHYYIMICAWNDKYKEDVIEFYLHVSRVRFTTVIVNFLRELYLVIL